jgi:hypothetical protein
MPTLPTIARADVAHFMREELDNPGHVGRVLPQLLTRLKQLSPGKAEHSKLQTPGFP